MVSTLDFRFDAHDRAGREKAKEKFLLAVLDTCQKVRKVFADHGADDVFLDLLMLQSVWIQQFNKFPRGFPLVDDDMRPAAVGPVAELLFAFRDIVKDSILQDFEKALTECEAKIGKSVEKAAGDACSA